jgi:predicted transcriptional regulator
MPINTPVKKDESITIRVQERLKSKLLVIAAEKDRPLSWVVHKILQQYLDESQDKL